MQNHEVDETLSDACFRDFLKLIHDLTGVTIDETRKSMLISRLRKRVRATGLPDFESYLGFVREDRDEVDHFVDNVTTHETYFYRTPGVWTYFRDVFLPEWVEANGPRTLHVWSAAASTGAEAHTIGVFLEDFKSTHAGFDYVVLGSDVSSQVIETSRQGLYVGRSVERFRRAQPELFARYMSGDEASGYRASPEIRGAIKFKTHNLFRPLSHTARFDIVFLRNVLIYFTKEDQEAVLGNIHQQMTPGGVLIIGESETLSRLSTSFRPVVPMTYRADSACAEDAA